MKSNRCGFTLIELLVMIVLILLLAAIILPALYHSRQAALRSQCKKNLSQIGLALHNYHEAHNALPPGWIASNSFGWNAMLLPHLGNTRLYKKLDFNRPWTADPADVGVTLQFLRCPADSNQTSVGPPLLTLSAARSNYPGVSGGTRISSMTVDVTLTQGTFGENSYRNFRHFSDGLSNAVIVGERGSSGGSPGNRGGDTIWAGVRDNNTPQGQALVVGDCAETNPPNFRDRSPTAANPEYITGFSSFHAGGSHFLMGDGSVRFIDDNINSTACMLLSTINDSMPLCEF